MVYPDRTPTWARCTGKPTGPTDASRSPTRKLKKYGAWCRSVPASRFARSRMAAQCERCAPAGGRSQEGEALSTVCDNLSPRECAEIRRTSRRAKIFFVPEGNFLVTGTTKHRENQCI